MLCEAGIPKKVIDNDYAQNLPMIYTVDGVDVEFLPHWSGNKYLVNGYELSFPASITELKRDVEIVKQLQLARVR